jgi:hypothetical protein
MPIIAGIDYSMSSPGMTIVDSRKPFIFENMQMFFLTDKPKFAKSYGNVHGFDYPVWLTPEERFAKVADIFMSVMRKLNVKYVMLEGYSYGSAGRTFHLAENLSVLKHYMWKEDIVYFETAPSSLKKMATGNGRADKPEMVRKFNDTICTDRTLNDIIGLSSKNIAAKPVDDLVDSAWLAKTIYDQKNWKTV